MSGAQTSLYDKVLSMTGSKTVADTVANSALGSLVSSGAQAIGGWGNLGSLLGGVAGALDSGGSDTASSTNTIDPRMAQYLYGSGYGDTNSLLGRAQEIYNSNKSGINSTMQQGLDMTKAYLTDPATTQSWQTMLNQGNSLLGSQVAANPFTGANTSMQTGLLDPSQLIAKGRALVG